MGRMRLMEPMGLMGLMGLMGSLFDIADADEVLGYLHGIECGAFLYLVADEPEGDAVGVGEVFADATYEDVVAVLVEERHGVGT